MAYSMPDWGATLDELRFGEIVVMVYSPETLFLLKGRDENWCISIKEDKPSIVYFTE